MAYEDLVRSSRPTTGREGMTADNGSLDVSMPHKKVLCLYGNLDIFKKVQTRKKSKEGVMPCYSA